MRLECSSKGDKRYSAFGAHVEVFGKKDSIERHYQGCKRFDGKALPFKQAKGRKVTSIILDGLELEPSFLTPFYKMMWVKYLDSNPQLVVYASKFDEFTDMFRGKSINCQADVIEQYIKHGRSAVLNDCQELFKLLKERKPVNVLSEKPTEPVGTPAPLPSLDGVDYIDVTEEMMMGVQAPKATVKKTTVVNKKHDVPYDVYIGRGSKWGNPFSHLQGTQAQYIVGSRDEAVEAYRQWIMTQPALLNSLHELKGKVLACYCSPEACHGHVLAELADACDTTPPPVQKQRTVTVAVTGHRPKKLGGDNFFSPLYLGIANELRARLLTHLEQNGQVHAFSGMAIGIDMLFALVVIKLKGEGYPIKLECAIPCANQHARWSPEQRQLWNDIIGKADKVTYVSKSDYFDGCMQMRNIYMVDSSNELIAVWDGTSGGTKNTVDHARIVKCPIYRIDPKDVKLVNVVVNQTAPSPQTATAPTNQTSSRLIYVEGDLLDDSNNLDFVLHQANCKKTMKRGLADSIRKKYPEAYAVDVNDTRTDKERFGWYTLAETTGPVVVNLYGQFDYGTDYRRTDYGALKNAVRNFLHECEFEYDDMENMRYGIPAGLGCGLAGGEWSEVSRIFEEAAAEFKVHFHVYNHNPKAPKKQTIQQNEPIEQSVPQAPVQTAGVSFGTIESSTKVIMEEARPNRNTSLAQGFELAEIAIGKLVNLGWELVQFDKDFNNEEGNALLTLNAVEDTYKLKINVHHTLPKMNKFDFDVRVDYRIENPIEEMHNLAAKIVLSGSMEVDYSSVPSYMNEDIQNLINVGWTCTRTEKCDPDGEVVYKAFLTKSFKGKDYELEIGYKYNPGPYIDSDFYEDDEPAPYQPYCRFKEATLIQ